MLNLTRKNESDETYIVGAYHSNDDKDITVEFADGTKYVVKNTPENIGKISTAMENQALAGTSNLGYFKLSNVGCCAGAFASIVGGMFGGVLASNIGAGASLGCLILGIGISAYPIYKAVGNSMKITEIEKIQYRNAYSDRLDVVKVYENALANVSNNSVREHIESHDDPFNAMYLNEFTKKDLQAIVKDVDREKKFGFTYKKKMK